MRSSSSSTSHPQLGAEMRRDPELLRSLQSGASNRLGVPQAIVIPQFVVPQMDSPGHATGGSAATPTSTP